MKGGNECNENVEGHSDNLWNIIHYVPACFEGNMYSWNTNVQKLLSFDIIIENAIN